MMNFASYHKKVIIEKYPHAGGEIILENVQLIVSGNYLIANGAPTRDEEKNEKHVTTQVFDFSTIKGYKTTTAYFPEEGLDNRQLLKE